MASSPRLVLLWIILSALLFSCRKDDSIMIQCDSPILCNGSFYNFSTADYDYDKRHLISNSPFLGTVSGFGTNKYIFSSFNPLDGNEFAYCKAPTKNPSLETRELWKFNGCTGKAALITDNFYYNIDWGSNGWILYTGTGYQIYKIKANGDSLTQLTNQSGFNNAGKWNPSGTLYYSRSSLEIYNDIGEVVYSLTTSPFGPKGWLDDSTLLGTRNANLYSLSILTETLTLLNTNWVSTTSSYVVDIDKKYCYVPINNGISFTDYLLRYDLGSPGARDTILLMYDSYYYGVGDYQSGKILTTLVREHWKDSTYNERYQE